MTERTTRVNRGVVLKVEPKTMANGQDESRKVLADLTLEHAKMRNSAHAARQLVDAQMKETIEDHARKLNTLRN